MCALKLETIVVSYCRMSEKILTVEDKGEIVLYNLCAQKIKNLQVRGLPSLFVASQIMVYEESLVSIMG